MNETLPPCDRCRAELGVIGLLMSDLEQQLATFAALHARCAIPGAAVLP